MADSFGAFFGGMGGGSVRQSPTRTSAAAKKSAWQTGMQSGMQQLGAGMQQLGNYQASGGSGLPIISPIMQGIQQHDQLKQQGRVLHTQMQLNRRASKADQRKTTGSQVALTGASGLRTEGSTLDLINQTNFEFELDQAIMKHSYRLQRDAMDRAGDDARTSGFMKGGMDLGKMFMGGF